jgi:hypothetical protein
MLESQKQSLRLKSSKMLGMEAELTPIQRANRSGTNDTSGNNKQGTTNKRCLELISTQQH